METKLREIKKSYDSKLITEQEYQYLRNKIINQINTTPNQSTANNSDCVVVKENGVIELKNISLLTQGVFNMGARTFGELTTEATNFFDSFRIYPTRIVKSE